MLARPGLPAFEYYKAQSYVQAVRLLLENRAAARLLMGGTDLFPAMRDGLVHPRVLIDVKHLAGMGDIAYDNRTQLRVGAAVTMNQLASHPQVRAHHPVLAQAAGCVAVYQVRNRATLGGNLCNASPCADTAPAALVLDAILDLYGPEGKRSVPVSDWLLGPGQTAIRPGELLTGIRFPAPPSGGVGRYLKLGRSKAGDLSLVGVAVFAFPDATASGCRFRIGLGSVAPTPIRASEAEEYLAGAPPGEESFAHAAQKAMEASSPIADVRGTAEYQRAMVRTLTLRALRDVWARMREVG